MTYTVPIPGGTAELLERTELTARRQRAIEVITLQSPSLIKKMNTAGTVKTPDGKVIENPDGNTDNLPEIELDEKESTLFFRIQDATLYALLKSWTLPQPIPETVDAVQDLPSPVYTALMQGVKAAPTTADAASFEPNDASVEDQGSPFGNSEPSPAP